MRMPNTSRRVYSAEELHRLRGSQSQPKLHEAIEEHDSEDAEIVKGHVIRGSKSFTARSFRSRNASSNSLRVPLSITNNENASTFPTNDARLVSRLALLPGGVLGEISGNGQSLRPNMFRLGPSPTPSIKKKKAEALVKNHGSPQHVRVTAGGRIVPSEQSPLTYPRYGYSAVKANGGVIKFAPNLHGGHEIRDHATEENFIAQDEYGNFCQIIDGIVKPIRIVNGSYQLERNPPNVVDQSTQNDLSWCLDKSLPPTNHAKDLRSESPTSHEPTVATQIAALELEYRRLEIEAKDVDKTEALYGRSMPKAALATLVASRRRLVTEKDKIRVSLKFLRKLKNRSASSGTRSPQARLTSRLPSSPYSRPHNSMPTQQSYGHNYNNPQYAPFYPGSIPGYAATMEPHLGHFGDDGFGTQPWISPPPGVFVQPPAYDGSMGPPYHEVQPSGQSTNTPEQNLIPPQNIAPDQLPQTDGSRSTAELYSQPEKSSHAVPIRRPNSKGPNVLKSGLNPMSPVYRPTGKIHAQEPEHTSADVNTEPPLVHGSPFSRPILEAPADRTMRLSEDTISPTKKVTHLHSSSISSIDTADFFPRNPREYSTRQLAYPLRLEHSDDKENTSPEGHHPRRDESPTILPGQGNHDSNWNPVLPDEVFETHENRRSSARVTSSTGPVMNDTGRPRLPIDAVDGPGQDLDAKALPNRKEDNTSPKAKRTFMFVEEHPELSDEGHTLNTCSPALRDDYLDRKSRPVDIIDFSQKPSPWIEGYQAGLQRRPIGAHHMGDFLDGYCSGLLKSRPTPQPSGSSSARKEPSDSTVHHPLPPLPPSAADSPTSEPQSPTTRHVLEDLSCSKDELKQAVFAPHNECAVLSPTALDPHVDEQPMNLGSWAKSATGCADTFHGYPFPKRTVSMLQRQAVPVGSQRSPDTKESNHRVTGNTGQPLLPSDNDATKAPSPASTTASPASRNHITSLNPSASRQQPAHRTASHHLNWPPMSSLVSTAVSNPGRPLGSHVTGSQYDGSAGQASRRIMSDPVPNTSPSRFHEGSLDGRSSPALSPRLASNPVGSPPLSPGGSHGHDSSKRGTRNSSPSKNLSPTKTKMEQIAGKVGMKVLSYATAGEASAEPEPASPSSPGKRRWRAVWRSGKTKDSAT